MIHMRLKYHISTCKLIHLDCISVNDIYKRKYKKMWLLYCWSIKTNLFLKSVWNVVIKWHNFYNERRSRKIFETTPFWLVCFSKSFVLKPKSIKHLRLLVTGPIPDLPLNITSLGLFGHWHPPDKIKIMGRGASMTIMLLLYSAPPVWHRSYCACVY